LIKGNIVDSDGDFHVVDLFGQKAKVLKSRTHSKNNSVLYAIRPEKLRIDLTNNSRPGNTFTGGKIVDVSYIGVSTQYQVEMPWGQEIMVFEQNDDGVPPLDKGDTVTLSWEPLFAFALDGSEDATAGSEVNPEEE
jgi:spermidine/putrescine transport system ATP-binding protein